METVINQFFINKVGFKQSSVDDCVFYNGNMMYMLYTDDSILDGPHKDAVDQVIQDIQDAKLNITIERYPQYLLGMNIDSRQDGSIHITQPHLINQILEDLSMGKKVKPKSTSALSSRLLSKYTDLSDFDKPFEYRSVLDKQDDIEEGSISNISYITHYCTDF